MFLGTYRLYRTDNAEARQRRRRAPGTPISGDLTSGCTGAAPNGARGCLISRDRRGRRRRRRLRRHRRRLGLRSARTRSTSRQPDLDPRRRERAARTVRSTRSPWTGPTGAIAYVAYAGFGAATPGNRGHVFATTDGGQHWTRRHRRTCPTSRSTRSCIDPADPNTLYAGTDVGAFVTHQRRRRAGQRLGSRHAEGGASGSSTTTPANGVLPPAPTVAAPTPSRTAAPRRRSSSPRPTRACRSARAARSTTRSRCATSATPRRPASPSPTRCPAQHDVRLGRATAARRRRHDVHVDRPDRPGRRQRQAALHACGSRPRCRPRCTTIVNDGIVVTSAQGVGTTGSPHTTPIAPAHAVARRPGRRRPAAPRSAAPRPTPDVTNDGYQRRQLHPGAHGGTLDDHDLRRDLHDAADDDADRRGRGDRPTYASRSPCPRVPPTATTDTTHAHRDVGRRPVGLGVGDAHHDRGRRRHAARRRRHQRPGRLGAVLQGRADGARQSLRLLGPRRRTRTCRVATSTAHKNVVWFTGNAYPAPITPYESELAAFLDGGGRLFMSGQDILDQAAGTTAFVQTTCTSTGTAPRSRTTRPPPRVTASPATRSRTASGTVPIDHSVLGRDLRGPDHPDRPGDRRRSPTTAAQTDALTVADGGVQGGLPGLPVRGVRHGGAQGRPDDQDAGLVRHALTVPRSRVSPAARPGSAARTARCPRGRRAPPSRRRPGRCPPGSRRGR